MTSQKVINYSDLRLHNKYILIKNDICCYRTNYRNLKIHVKFIIFVDNNMLREAFLICMFPVNSQSLQRTGTLKNESVRNGMLFTSADTCCSQRKRAQGDAVQISLVQKKYDFWPLEMDDRAAGNRKTERLPSHYLHRVLQSIRQLKLIDILRNIFFSEHKIRNSRIARDRGLIVVSTFDVIVIFINSWHYTSPLEGKSIDIFLTKGSCTFIMFRVYLSPKRAYSEQRIFSILQCKI